MWLFKKCEISYLHNVLAKALEKNIFVFECVQLFNLKMEIIKIRLGVDASSAACEVTPS